MMCPHCGLRARIRSSEQLTPVISKVYCQCNNANCGHQFTAIVELLNTTHRGRNPNPEFCLPVSPKTKGIYKKQCRRTTATKLKQGDKLNG